MTKLHRTFASAIALGSLLLPALAHANNSSGTVVMVRTCPDSGGGQRVVVKINEGANVKHLFLGIDSAGSSAKTSIAMSALLSGRTVTIEHSGSAAVQCGVNALYANSTSHYIQLNN